MNHPRSSGAILMGIAALGALLLSGCSADANTTPPAATSTGSSSAAALISVGCGGKSALKASGSTAQANAMTSFINAFEADCPSQTLDYTSNGSGAGVSEFIGGQTDFGGSDSPLNAANNEPAQAAARCGSPAWDLPVVFGPIAITYNLKGVSTLILDGPTAAAIFNGTVKTWNDPAIAKLNPGVTFPSEPINVVYRSDSSGTTDNFQKYLKGASNGAWTQGTGKTFNGGVGEGASGNEGTSAAINTTDGGITYNEWSFAKSQNLAMAEIITSAGPTPVSISVDSVGKTIAGAKISGTGNDLVLDTSSFYTPTDPGAYPIVLATYELVCSKYADPQVGTAVKAVLASMITNGQQGLADIGYIPIPDTFLPKLVAAINAIS